MKEKNKFAGNGGLGKKQPTAPEEIWNISMNRGLKSAITAIILLIFSVISVTAFAEEVKTMSLQESHQNFAAGFNGLVWSLLTKEDRTEQENDVMINAAHASRLHWGYIGTKLNTQRGEWLIARVYAVLNRPEPSLYHAFKCMKITEAENIQGFDLAYAYEAMARAYSAAGEQTKAQEFIKLATEAGEKIEKAEDKELFFNDFNSEPWYGVK